MTAEAALKALVIRLAAQVRQAEADGDDAGVEILTRRKNVVSKLIAWRYKQERLRQEEVYWEQDRG